MTRGREASLGDESLVNGYIYVNIGPKKWKPKHRLIMEQHLGRQLTVDEYIRFKDGDRLNLDLGNLKLVQKKRPASDRKRQLEERLDKLRTEMDIIQDKLNALDHDSEPVEDRIKGTLAVLDGHKCLYCGATAVTYDYLIPVSRVTDVKNRNRPNVPRVLACQECASILRDTFIDSVTGRIDYVAKHLKVTERSGRAEGLSRWLRGLPAPEASHGDPTPESRDVKA